MACTRRVAAVPPVQAPCRPAPLMGARQVAYGRRNLELVRVVIVLYLIFMAAALAVSKLSRAVL